MESQYQQHPQAMGQSPFFYYNPDPNADKRQHGHFSQQPQMQAVYHPQFQPMQMQMQMQMPQPPPLPSTPVYSRPSSSCCQSPMPVYNNGYPMQHQHMTPMASPRPMYQKPTILIQEHSPRLILDSQMDQPDMYYYPSTPPLSTSGSTISSPSSVEIVTPMAQNSFFGHESLEGVKAGCHGDVQAENLAGGEWARCGSPPMTPVFIQPNSVNTSDLLSATACPSLSPSPSPFQQSLSSEQTFDFCDPRNLTVGANSSNPTLSVAYPALPTLCAGDDDEHKYMLGEDTFNKAANENNTFTFTHPSHPSLPAFDEFSDLESEEDFVNGCLDFPAAENVQYFGAKRQRTDSGADLISIHDSFLSEEDEFQDFEDSEQFATACLPSPPASSSEVEHKPAKRSKKNNKRSPDYEDSSEFDHMVRSRKYTVPMNAATGTPAHESTQEQQQQAQSIAPSQSGSSEAPQMVGTPSEIGGTSGGAPVNRRGRKQSLTEDPSKTFVCELCNRRFRRQEHLKRHYRSLHTQDKPFSCGECGKEFSRSDNLSQHARTHGSGAIVMGVLEDGELPRDHPDSASEGEIKGLGHVLFGVAAAAPGSESGSSESDNPRKKRKRSSD